MLKNYVLNLSIFLSLFLSSCNDQYENLARRLQQV